jgi:prophage regulatory protein
MSLVLQRRRDVLAQLRESNSGFYSKIQKGELPPPVRVGERCSAWPSHEIDAIVNARIAGATVEQMRQLVQQLVEQRAALMPPLIAPATSSAGGVV